MAHVLVFRLTRLNKCVLGVMGMVVDFVIVMMVAVMVVVVVMMMTVVVRMVVAMMTFIDFVHIIVIVIKVVVTPWHRCCEGTSGYEKENGSGGGR